MSQFADALMHYRIRFPNIESLGAGSPPARWAKEYEAVSGVAFAPVLLTTHSEDGRSASGQAAFSSQSKIRALVARRAELDTDFAVTIASPPPQIGGQTRGSVIRFGH